MSREGAWRPVAGRLELRVRATPRSGRDGLEGLETGSDGRPVLKVRVRAAPENGAANEAVRHVLAKALSLPPSAVSLTRGAGARMKTFLVDGDAAGHAATLDRIAGGKGP